MSRGRAANLFAAVAQHHRTPWTLCDSPKFGANALKVHGKIFAALTRSEQLLLKLPPARAAGLIAARHAQRFSSGGRVLNGWIVVLPGGKAEWIALSQEARDFVATQAAPRKRTP
jgi:hypothetical protein